MNNPYAMNMIVKQRQEEIRRQADLYRQIEESEGGFGKWWRERSAIALMSLMVAASALGLVILV